MGLESVGHPRTQLLGEKLGSTAGCGMSADCQFTRSIVRQVTSEAVDVSGAALQIDLSYGDRLWLREIFECSLAR